MSVQAFALSLKGMAWLEAWNAPNNNPPIRKIGFFIVEDPGRDMPMG
jgi:hypothetical protein